jgi:HSP20 family protein
MSRLLEGRTLGGREMLRPAVDILEEEDAIVLKAELPGVKPEDVDITIENGMLTISGERRLESEEKRENYHRVESSYGSFSRSFALPDRVDPSSIEASMASGILNLRIAKRAEAQPRKIEVKASRGEEQQVPAKMQAGASAGGGPQAKSESRH